VSDRDEVQVARWSAIKGRVGTSLRELRQGQHAGDAGGFASRSQARLAGDLEELGYHVTQSMVSRYEQGLLDAPLTRRGYPEIASSENHFARESGDQSFSFFS